MVFIQEDDFDSTGQEVPEETMKQNNIPSTLHMATSECQLQVDEHDIDTDTSIAMNSDLTLDVVSPSYVTAGAEILLDISSENTSQRRPPILALEAIEKTLTPNKKASYIIKDANGTAFANDPVYSTWRCLEQQVNGVEIQEDSILLYEANEHPIVAAGLIPRRLADVFRSPPKKKKQMRRGTTSKARVLASEKQKSTRTVSKPTMKVQNKQHRGTNLSGGFPKCGQRASKIFRTATVSVGKLHQLC